MVVTEQHYATQVGVDVLRRGGNAVDAAVAVGYALAVVDPCCGNIGGGGFMLVRLHDGRERFIDFRERAPARATPSLYPDKNGNVIPGLSTKGYLAVGVPGTVMGLDRARTEFGTRSRAALMAPAIALAKDGYLVGADDARVYKSMPGDTIKAGDIRKQPDLAATLALIARDGPNAFYRGAIAQAIVAASNANGGILSTKDFASYYVNELQPVHCSYRGYDLISAPPPSSGGVTLCEILNIVSPYNFTHWGWNSTQSAHYAVEAERRAYADRNTYLGDPSFVKNPIPQLLNPRYAAKLRASISANRATPSSQVDPGLGAVAHENAQTTSFSIVDSAGNAVAVTYTINDWFGAGVIALVVLQQCELHQFRIEHAWIRAHIDNGRVVPQRFRVIVDGRVIVMPRLFDQSKLKERLGMAAGEAHGPMERALGPGVVLMRLADEAKVVPGLVELGVGVDGALELALGVLRKAFRDEKRAELVVQRCRMGIRAQRRDRVADLDVEAVVAGGPLRIKRRRVVGIRALVAMERAAGHDGDRGGCEKDSFHHHS